MKKLLLTMMVLAAVLSLVGAGSFAYLSDSEILTGNSFSAGIWAVAPEVAVISPNGGESWFLGHTYTIEWAASDLDGDDDSLLSIDIWYSADSGTTWTYQVASNIQNSGQYVWEIPINRPGPSPDSRIKVLATDGDGFSAWDMSDRDFYLRVEVR